MLPCKARPRFPLLGSFRTQSMIVPRNVREPLTLAAKLEIGVWSQEPGGRSQKKCLYKDEMLPDNVAIDSGNSGMT